MKRFHFTLKKQNGQAVILYAATLLGVLMGFLASVINTHAIPVNDYGDVRYVQNLIQFIASLLLFGYFLSGSRLLALSDDEQRNRRVRGVMVLILAFCSAILLLAVLVSALVHPEPSVRHLLLLSLPISLYPLLLSYVNTTAQGDNHIGRLSCARLLPAMLYVPLAYFVYRRWGCSSTLMVLLQWGMYSLVLLVLIFSTRPSFKEMRPVFTELSAENRSYGIHLYLGSLAMVGTQYLAGVMLGAFNDDNANVGMYTLAFTLTYPLAYLPSIVGTAYFKRFASMDAIPSQVIKGTALLTGLTLIGFVCLVRPLVSLMFPPAYAKVGIYSIVMALGFCLHGFGDMLNRYLGSHGKGKPILWASVACGVMRVSGFVLLVWLWNVVGALITSLLSSSIYFVFMFYYYRKFIHNPDSVN